MRFEQAYDGWRTGRLSQFDAAHLLEVCERSFRRDIASYEEDGLDGLMDHRLSQVSHWRAPVDEVMAVQERYRSQHQGWRVKHFYTCHQHALFDVFCRSRGYGIELSGN